MVAAGHNVLGAHQPLLQGVGQTALEQNGLVAVADFFQQLEVLHIPGTDLNDVHIVKQLQMLDVHQLRDNGHAGFFFCQRQQAQTLFAHALERVRGGAGLECAAPENLRAGGFYPLCAVDNLFLAFHGAGTGHVYKVAAADFGAVFQLHHGVGGVEFPVRLLERLGHPLDGFHDVQCLHQLGVDFAYIAHQTHDGGVGAFGNIGGYALCQEPVAQVLDLFFRCILFQNDNHFLFLLKK